MTAAVTIRIQEADFDVAHEIAALTKGRRDIGAVVSFSGICRGSEDGASIAALTLEHYPGMAEGEIFRHAETAMSRWPLTGLTVIHRVGRIAAGGRPHRRRSDGMAFGARRGLRPRLRHPARDPRRDRPRPCQIRYGDRRRPRDCLFPADDRRLSRLTGIAVIS